MPSTGATEATVRAEPPERPLPALSEPDTGPFWGATKEHRLTYQRCASCGETVFHPRRHCTRCLSTDLRWNDSVGHGAVYSYTVVRQHGHPYFRSRLPYVVGFIDLDDGFRMLAEIDAPADDVRIGQRVSVAWEDHAELAIPVFRPADAR
jgi:uncharacterized OB-fold protein